MRRFDDSFVAEVLARTNLVDLIAPYTQLKSSGQNLMGLCPFPDHREKTPSFSISPTKQVYHCFGCKRGGNAITFLRDFHGMSFPEAITALAERAGMSLPTGPENHQDTIRPILEAYSVALEIYEDVLWNSEEGQIGRAYLQTRGIDEKTARDFRLGLAPQRWDLLVQTLSHDPQRLGGAMRGGLIRFHESKNKHYDFFRERLMFPIFNLQGRVVAFGGRILPGATTKGAKYINSPEHPGFHKGELLFMGPQAPAQMKLKDRIILVEGYLDVIQLYQAGYPEAVAPLGTAFSQKQAELCQRWSRHLLVAFDADPAGKQAQKKALSLALESGLLPKGIKLPVGYDPDEYIKTFGSEAWAKLMEKAEDLFFLIAEEAKPQNPRSPVEMKNFSDFLKSLLIHAKDPELQALYYQEIQRRYGLKQSRVPQPITRLQLTKKSFSPDKKTSNGEKISQEEQALLALGFQIPALWQELVKMADWFSPHPQELIKQALNFTQNQGIPFDKVLTLMAGQLNSINCLQWDPNTLNHLMTAGPDIQKKFFHDVLCKLQKRYITDKIDFLKKNMNSQNHDQILKQINALLSMRKTLLETQQPLQENPL